MGRDLLYKSAYSCRNKTFISISKKRKVSGCFHKFPKLSESFVKFPKVAEVSVKNHEASESFQSFWKLQKFFKIVFSTVQNYCFKTAMKVFGSEMTVPYYAFSDAGIEVDIASIKGGKIPVEPRSMGWPLGKEEGRCKSGSGG